MLLPDMLYQLSPQDLVSAFTSEFDRIASGAAGTTSSAIIDIPEGFALIVDSLSVSSGVPTNAADRVDFVLGRVNTSGSPAFTLAINEQTGAAGQRVNTRLTAHCLVGSRRGVTRTIEGVASLQAGAVGTLTATLAVHGWLIPQGNLR